MQVKEYHNNPQEFLSIAYDHLYSHEVENGIIIGNTNGAISDPSKFDFIYLFTIVDETDNVVLVGFQTSMNGFHFPFALSQTSKPESVNILFEHLIFSKHISHIGESLVPSNVADKYLHLYNSTQLKKIEKSKEERVHKLTHVNPECLKGNGQLQIATDESFDLILKWYEEFLKEIGSCTEVDDSFLASLVKRTKLAVSQKRFFLLTKDAVPVAMALQNRETENVASIGAVYTPVQERNKKYATLLVAQLSRYCLNEQGKKFCCLLTDLANPVSNRIYKKIGYEPVSDFVHFK